MDNQGNDIDGKPAKQRRSIPKGSRTTKPKVTRSKPRMLNSRVPGERIMQINNDSPIPLDPNNIIHHERHNDNQSYYAIPQPSFPIPNGIGTNENRQYYFMPLPGYKIKRSDQPNALLGNPLGPPTLSLPPPHTIPVPEAYLRLIRQRYPVNPAFVKECKDLNAKFPTLKSDYHIFDKIGEGTFSSVYKAVDIKHDYYDNKAWANAGEDDDEDEIEIDKGGLTLPPPINANLDKSNNSGLGTSSLFTTCEDSRLASGQIHSSNSLNKPKKAPKFKLVAIKKIYVTSSCPRIENEIEILSLLSGHPNIVSLITAIRYEDQILAITPYYRHHDFRETFIFYSMQIIQDYMRCLLRALAHCHQYKIIHRDVKPSNFLYNMVRKRGQLADFGLAQRQGASDPNLTYSASHPSHSPHKFNLPSITDPTIRQNPNGVPLSFLDEKGRPGVPKNDGRPNIKANRAGTRGFRAPEVLFKVVDQTTAIDIWSAGVILLCMLTCKFPFFNSPTDHDALVEIGILFGRRAMQQLADSFNRTFETNVDSITDEGISLVEVIRFTNPNEFRNIPVPAMDLLRRLMVLDPKKRITAKDALNHPFLRMG